MSKTTLIIVGILGGAALGYFMAGTLSTWPVYSTVYNKAQSIG